MGAYMSMHVERFQDGQWQPVPRDRTKPFEPNTAIIASWKKRYDARDPIRGWEDWDEADRLQGLLEWYADDIRRYHNRDTIALLTDIRCSRLQPTPAPVKHSWGVPEGFSDILTLIMDQRWDEGRPAIVLLSDIKDCDFNQMVSRSGDPEETLAEVTREFTLDVLPAIEEAVAGTPPEHVRLALWFEW